MKARFTYRNNSFRHDSRDEGGRVSISWKAGVAMLCMLDGSMHAARGPFAVIHRYMHVPEGAFVICDESTRTERKYPKTNAWSVAS